RDRQRTGMVLDHASDSSFTDVMMLGNSGDGIRASVSNRNVISASLANDNGGSGLVGQDFDDNVLLGNGFHGNVGDGLRFEMGSAGTRSAPTIRRQRTGRSELGGRLGK